MQARLQTATITFLQLRAKMINGSSGVITAEVKKFFNKDLKKVYKVRQTYYYTPIEGTSYR